MTFKYSIPKYFSTPKLIKSPPRLTIKQIMTYVKPATKNKARKCKSLSIERMRGIKLLPGYFVYRVITLNKENGHRYKLTIFSPTEKITPNTKLLIDDPCGVWVYRYEYAMAKRGNAFIFRCNGDPPVVTNPRYVPGLSHHGVRAILDLIKHTKNYSAEKSIKVDKTTNTDRSLK